MITPEQYQTAIANAQKDGDFELAASHQRNWDADVADVAAKKAKVGVAPEGAALSTYGNDPVNEYMERMNGIVDKDEAIKTASDAEMRLQFFGQGASFGLTDDIYGMVTSAGLLMDQDYDLDGVVEDTDMFGKDGKLAKFWDRSREVTKGAAEERAAWAQQNKGEALMWEIMGGVATGGVGLAKAGVGMAAKLGNTTAAKAGAMAAVGAGEGAIYGIGTLDARFDKATDMAWHIASNAGLGAGFGAGIGGIMGAVGNKVAAKQQLLKTGAADEIMDNVNEAMIMARIDNPDALPSELVGIMRNGDLAGMYSEETIKAAIVASTKRLDIPNEATKETLQAYRAKMREANEWTPTSWLGKHIKANKDAGGYTNDIDNIMGSVMTRVNNVDKVLGARLMRHDYNVSAITEKRMTHVRHIERINKKENKALKKEVKKLMLKDDVVGVLARLRKHGEETGDFKILQGFRRTVETNRELAGDLRGVGFESGVGAYWQRVVKDPVKFRKALGAEDIKGLDAAMLTAAQKIDPSIKTMSAAKRALTDADQNAIINGYVVKGRRKSGAKVQVTGQAKERQIDEVEDWMEEFYADPVEAITSSIRRTTENVEERKLFGFDVNKGRDGTMGSGESIQLELSVAQLIRDRGITDQAQVEQLTQLLSARFGAGKQSSPRWVQLIKNVGLMSVLATPKSAMIQAADVGHSVLYNGWTNTMKAMFMRNGINTQAIGMQNKLGVEYMAGQTVTKDVRALDQFIRKTGFATVDRFGKNTYMKAAMLKNQQQIKTMAGEADFVNTYGKMFGGRGTRQLLADLQDPAKMMNPSDDMRLLMFTQLSDIQPLSLSQMPVAFHNNPRGRIFYTLKSFALKQADQMRRNVGHELMAGNNAAAAKNALNYGLITGSATYATNEVRNAIFTFGADPIEMNPEDLTSAVMWHYFAALSFTSKYAAEGAWKKGDAFSGAISLLPPTGVIGAGAADFLRTLAGEWNEDEFNFANMDTIKQLPGGVGGMLHMLFGKGMETKAQQHKARETERYQDKYGYKPVDWSR